MVGGGVHNSHLGLFFDLLLALLLFELSSSLRLLLSFPLLPYPLLLFIFQLFQSL